MTKIKLGELYSLKNHPFEIDVTDVKISALAQMTPPVLVVSEILNSQKEYDTESGKEKFKQVKFIFYSHKTHKFENFWIDINHVKKIEKSNVEIVLEKNEEIKTFKENGVKSDIVNYPKSTSLDELKDKFLNNQVILKSCDYELGKIKTTFVKTDNKSSQKLNSHLDFLPPVLTVIDVKLNDEKIGYNAKSGNLKKIASNFLLKCKWFNPVNCCFSEDFIPIETIQIVEKNDSLNIISELISKKIFFRNIFENHIKFESGQVLDHSYIQPLELIFNHYYYKLKYFDFFKTKYSEINLSKLNINNVEEFIDLSDLVIDKIPEYKISIEEFISVREFTFERGEYYRITYKDLQERITKRVILVKEFIPEKIVIADCLLRDGEERHFRIVEGGGILKIEVLDSKYFA